MTATAVDRDTRQDAAEVLVRYATSIDRRDWELFRTCFTADCHADYGTLGRWDNLEDLAKFMEELHTPMGRTLHRITNQEVTSNGESVEARSYFDTIVIAPQTRRLRTHAVGYYDDELARTAEGWKIADRRVTMVHIFLREA